MSKVLQNGCEEKKGTLEKKFSSLAIIIVIKNLWENMWKFSRNRGAYPKMEERKRYSKIEIVTFRIMWRNFICMKKREVKIFWENIEWFSRNTGT